MPPTIHGVISLSAVRTWWVATGHRSRLTSALTPKMRRFDGLVMDVGGGRDAPHDEAWPASARRVRIDITPTHRPDIQADAVALPIGDAGADGVLMVEVLEHLPNPGAAIAEARRVLRSGGILLGSAPFVWPVHGDPHDFFRFSEDGLRILLRDFSAVHIEPIGSAKSSAWVLLSSTSRAARVFNPLFRDVGRRPDPRAPEGYVFMARA
jgi:SAM-dependent methyltransferase